MRMQRTAHPPTAKNIVAEARRILQTDGYSRLRYADIAERLGIRGASIHYHFSKKSLLVAAVMADYRATFVERLAGIDREASTPSEKLDRYIDLYRSVFIEDVHRICPGGMLSAEISTLPPAIRREVEAFFEENESWLIKLFTDCQPASQSQSLANSSQAWARQVVSLLQGALLMARFYGDQDVFESAARLLKDSPLFTSSAQEQRLGIERGLSQ